MYDLHSSRSVDRFEYAQLGAALPDYHGHMCEIMMASLTIEDLASIIEIAQFTFDFMTAEKTFSS